MRTLKKKSLTERKEKVDPDICPKDSNWASQSLMVVLRNLNAAVCVIDKEGGQILFANHHAEKMFEELRETGKEISAYLPSETSDQSDVTKEFLEHTNLDGRECQFMIAGLKLAVQDLDIDWLEGRKARLKIARDVTDMNRMEEALIQSEARFRATLDNAAHAIVLTDDTGRFTQVNKAWEKMFGYTAEEAKKLTFLDVTHPDFREISKEKLRTVVNGDLDFYRIEKQYIRKDGFYFLGRSGCYTCPWA